MILKCNLQHGLGAVFLKLGFVEPQSPAKGSQGFRDKNIRIGGQNLYVRV